MNKKIKEIDIGNFRAYKDLQRFNFTYDNGRKIADLVAIYAPNGYGKTSFFDAIEWAVTDKIGRLEGGKPVEEERKSEKDYILKNKDVDAEFGTVKIVDEDNHILHICTKKKSGKMKGDYRPGEPVSISKELQTIWDEKDTFCTTNLLAHDKITSFLQRYTAEDKTNELRVMWDENNYSEILNNITELYSEIDKRKKQLTLDISKEEKELKKYSYENSQSEKIKELILNYEKNYGFQVLQNNAIFSEIGELLREFDNLYEKTQKDKHKTEVDVNVNDILLKDYSIYMCNKKNLQLKLQMKSEGEKALLIWENIEKGVQKRNNMLKKSQEFSDILGKISVFYECKTKMERNIKNMECVEKELINSQKQRLDITEKIQELEDKLKKGNEVIGEQQIVNRELQENFYKYEKSKLQIQKYKKLVIKAKYILEERQKRIMEYSLYISRIEAFREKKTDIDSIRDIISEQIISNYDFTNKLIAEKTLLIENIEALEKSKRNIAKLLDKIQQLLIQGKDIVVERNQNECPLCHMKYNDCEELLGKISENANENKELLEIDSQLKKNMVRKEELEVKIKEVEQEIDIQIVAIHTRYKKQYTTEMEKTTRLQEIITSWESMVDSAESICKNLVVSYLEKGVDISVKDSVENKEKEINKEITFVKKNIEFWQAENENHKKKLDLINKSIRDCNLRILEIKEENSNIKVEPIFLEVGKFLEESDLYKSEFSYEEMKEVIENQCKMLSEQLSEIEKQLVDNQSKVTGKKEEFELKLESLLKEINELQVNIDSYLLRCKSAIGEVESDERIAPIIEQLNTDLKEKIKELCERSEKEDNILLGLRNLKEQKMWLDRKESCQKQKERLELLDKRLEKLGESKNYVEEFIVERTNEYFNSDIINQIYNKIDPHPTMKHIKFITSKDKKGLKTHIYTYDDSEENMMSPVLYLSSAQVNILSLCIFLSKVLSEKNTTFNTIFMDDPIQHLDGINLLAFIDLLRTITTEMGRQIIISTHNEHFYELLKVKMDADYYPSKFIELGSAGVIK